MNPHCECPVFGFCERHNREKNIREHELCKIIADTSDGGMKYWNAWEEGKLGATAPDKPVLNPTVKREYSKPKRTVRRAAIIRHNASPTRPSPVPIKHDKGAGTELHKLLEKIGISIQVGCKCKWWINRMNAAGTEWCKVNVEVITDNMLLEAERRDWKPRTNLMQKFTRILAKKLVHAAIKKAENNGG